MSATAKPLYCGVYRVKPWFYDAAVFFLSAFYTIDVGLVGLAWLGWAWLDSTRQDAVHHTKQKYCNTGCHNMRFIMNENKKKFFPFSSHSFILSFFVCFFFVSFPFSFYCAANTESIHDKHTGTHTYIQFGDYLFMQQQGKKVSKSHKERGRDGRKRNTITMNEMFRVKSFQSN